MATLGEWGQFLVGLGTFAGVLFSAVQSRRNAKKLHEIGESTNGKMDRLLHLTASSSKAEGRLERSSEISHGKIPP